MRRDYLAQILAAIFSSEAAWVLVPRYGDAGQCGLVTPRADLAAIRVESEDTPALIAFLLAEPAGASRDRDIYLLGDSGTALVTWDHHTQQDGLCLQFSDISRSSRALVLLNELGAEFDVFGRGD